VSISKADITTNKELEGAELVLIKKTGETEVEVIKWTSTKTPYRIELEAGTYILKELKVPTGYKNDPIVILVNLLNFHLPEKDQHDEM